MHVIFITKPDVYLNNVFQSVLLKKIFTIQSDLVNSKKIKKNTIYIV